VVPINSALLGRPDANSSVHQWRYRNRSPRDALGTLRSFDQRGSLLFMIWLVLGVSRSHRFGKTSSGLCFGQSWPSSPPRGSTEDQAHACHSHTNALCSTHIDAHIRVWKGCSRSHIFWNTKASFFVMVHASGLRNLVQSRVSSTVFSTIQQKCYTFACPGINSSENS